MKDKKYVWTGIFLVEILVLVMGVGTGIFAIRNSPKIETSLDSWESEYIEYDGSWHINEATMLIPISEEVSLLRGPYAELPKGNYTIKIQYESEKDQRFKVYADSENSEYIKAMPARLSKNQTSVSYKITTTEDIDNFEIIVYYNGTGYFEIKDITIEASTAGIRRQFVTIFLIFVLLDICLLFSNVIKQNKNLLLALAGIIALSSMPLLIDGMRDGHDLDFHIMRIEGIAEELLHGNIPVKLSSLYMDGYGYPVSVYYGDLLLYIPAFFRLAGFSIMTSYEIYIFLINIGTTILSYYCFGKIFKDKRIALLTSFAYVTANYRMICIYTRAAVGEYSAMAFLPVVAYAVYWIYTEDATEWKHYRKGALLLALGMTGLIGTHVLTVEMTVIAMLLFCIVLWKKTLRRNTLRVYALAITATLLLNLYFVVPFMDYYRNVDVNISNTVWETSAKIQNYGAYIADYFSFFITEVYGRMRLTPGIILMTGFVSAIVLWVNKKATKEIQLLTAFAALFLYMASNLFPWNHLTANYKWGNVLAQIQFPWRYIGIADIFLTILLGMILKQILTKEMRYQDAVCTSVFILNVFAALFLVSSYNYTDALKFSLYDTAELATYEAGAGEYIRSGTNVSQFTGKTAQKNMQTVNLISRNGSYMELYCESSNVNGTIEIPMSNYKGYQVMDEYGTKYEIVDGANNVISFTVPAGFSGKITIDFVEPWYWRLAEILSLITVLFICIRMLLLKHKTISLER